MSRSTASPPLERGALPEGDAGASETDEDERQAMRPRRLSQPGLLGARTTPRSTSRTFAIDDRRETNPHSNPLEVHCDADAVRSVPRD
jgi:hypothetical protein